MTTRISQAQANAVAALYATNLDGQSAILYAGAVPATAGASVAGNTAIATFSASASATNNVVTITAAADVADATETATFMRIGSVLQGEVGAEVTVSDPAIIAGSNVNLVSMTLTIPLA